MVARLSASASGASWVALFAGTSRAGSILRLHPRRRHAFRSRGRASESRRPFGSGRKSGVPSADAPHVCPPRPIAWQLGSRSSRRIGRREAISLALRWRVGMPASNDRPHNSSAIDGRSMHTRTRSRGGLQAGFRPSNRATTERWSFFGERRPLSRDVGMRDAPQPGSSSGQACRGLGSRCQRAAMRATTSSFRCVASSRFLARIRRSSG